MTKLKIVPKPAKLEEGSNFWNCCPLQKQLLPTEHCLEGKPTLEKNKVTDEPACPWWLNSSKDNYCFWKYIKRVSEVDGSMPELSQTELSKVLGWSSTKTQIEVKEATDELSKILKEQGFDLELIDLHEYTNSSSITKSIINNSTE